MQEIWKVIPDSDGHYFVSNLGSVRREEYDFIDKAGRKYHREAKIISGHIHPQAGYVGCHYRTDEGNSRTRMLHQIVMDTFNPNPNPELYDQINHIDGVKTNNCLNNLEWSNTKLNMQHASKMGLINRDSEKRKQQCKINSLKSYEVNRHPVVEYDEEGKLIKIHKGVNLAGNGSLLHRLSYKGHYYRDYTILMKLYNQIPKIIDISYITPLLTKDPNKNYSCEYQGQIIYYNNLKDLPITRDTLWYCFNHNIPDSQGRKWNIFMIKHTYSQQYSDEFIEDILQQRNQKGLSYKQVAEQLGLHKATIYKWNVRYKQIHNIN